MSQTKKVLVVDVDDDIESLIVRHPSGDEEEIGVLGGTDDADDDGDDGEEEEVATR